MRPQTRTPPAMSADALAAFGGRPALIADDGALTYRALADRVRARAAELGPGRRLVMIHGGNTADAIVSYLAALDAGHVAWLVPAGAEGSPPPAAWLPPDVVVPRAGGRIVELDPGSMHDLHPELALLLGTSGSTGAPRLVRISHASLLSNAEAIASYLGITASDRAVTSLPMHYCYGLSVVNSHLVRGAALVLTERSVADGAFWDLARGQGATSFAGVPHTFELLDRIGFAEMELPSLRYVTQAGGRLAPDRVRRYAALGARDGWRFVVMYGQTEATARMAYLPPEMAREHPGAVGVAIPGGSFEIRAVPEAGEPGVGELVYRGPNVMLGYAESPADLALGRTVHELPTGDLARRGPSGLIEITGRRSRFLKLFGLRVDLDEVERILHRQGIAAACTGSDERMVIAVAGPIPPGVIAALARHLGLPPSCVGVLTPPEIPRLPNGKTDYRALTAMAQEPGDASPRSDVAAAFCDVLGREAVAGGDSFASLGGDSLSYVEMSLALEEVLGHLPDDWPHRTVADLSACARRRRRGVRLETNVVLRAAAVALVVASHMTAFWPAGGAHLLLALAGYSFARFQLGAHDVPGRLARSASSITRIALPASAWIGLVMLSAGGYGLGTLLLVNNYAGATSFSGGRWHYWFIEVLVQLLIVLTALFCIPAVRRLERRDGFLFVLGLLAPALAVRFDLLGIGPEPNHIFRTHTVAWLFLLGWAVQRATTPAHRLAVTGLVVACIPGFFGETAREAVIIGGLLLLIWVPVVAVPGRLSRPVALVAAASLYIYLTHWQVWPALAAVLPLGLALPLTIAAGIGAWMLVERATPLLARAARLRPHPSSGRGLRRVSEHPAPAAAPGSGRA